MPPFSLLLYLLSSVIVFLDFFDFLVRLAARARSRRRAGSSPPSSLRPYALLVSVHNISAELGDFLESLAPWRDCLWVIDDASTDDTWDRLQKSGVHAVRAESNSHKPGALRQLLAALPGHIESVVVLDPDVVICAGRKELGEIVLDFQRSGAGALCPRIEIRHDNWLTRFQEFEYWQSFTLGRRSLGECSITSGIAVYRRQSLARILEQHSLSVYAEDLENAILLQVQGESVYYDGRLVMVTEGKRTLKGWFSQRVGWSFGLLKVYSERWQPLWRNRGRGGMFVYQHFIYTCILSLLLHPLKLVSILLLAASGANAVDHLALSNSVPDTAWTHPLYLVLAYGKYTLLSLMVLWVGVERGRRGRLFLLALVYFFYAVAHMVPATIGYLNWISLRLWRRRVFRDHFSRLEWTLERRPS